MKLIADEHVSPRIVRAVCEIALTKSTCSLCSVIGNSDYQATEDEDWIDRFAKDGGRGVLSADRKMLRRPTLIKRITDHGMVGVFLPAEWANSRRVYQASHILYWWQIIEKHFHEAPGGTAWVVPKGHGGGELRQYVRRVKSARQSAAE